MRARLSWRARAKAKLFRRTRIAAALQHFALYFGCKSCDGNGNANAPPEDLVERQKPERVCNGGPTIGELLLNAVKTEDLF